MTSGTPEKGKWSAFWKWAIGGSSFAVVLFIAICAYFYIDAYKNNQIVRPPFAAPAPVIPRLPEFAATLRQCKTQCEAGADRLVELERTGKVDAARVAKCRGLYDDVRGLQDGCVEYIEAGLESKFSNSDLPKIEKTVQAIEEASDEFLTCVSKAERPDSNTGALWNDGMKEVRDIFDLAGKRNEAAVKAYQERFEKLRLKPWPRKESPK